MQPSDSHGSKFPTDEKHPLEGPGQKLILPAKQPPAPTPVPAGSSSCFVKTGINQRENNEDSFHIYDLYLPAGQKLKILAIADGMGGHAYGEHVSREALHKTSLALFEQLCVDPVINNPRQTELRMQPGQIAPAIWNALEQANSYIRKMVQTNKWGKAGSTIVMTAIFSNRAIVANLGDSPLFHYRATERSLKQITEDHTVAGALLRGGMITPEMALYHEGRSRLEFFIGVEALPHNKKPVYSVQLTPGDLLLLCTDGVSGRLDLHQIEAILANPANTLEAMADQLFEEALKKEETDNQTLILWRYGPAPVGQSAPEKAQTAIDDLHNAPTVYVQRSQIMGGNPAATFQAPEEGTK